MAEKHITRLLVVSHVIHYKWNNAFYAYNPYAREIEIWADLFPRVIIAAPLRNERPPSDCRPFGRTNIEVSEQLEHGGNTWYDKIFRTLSLPFLLIGLANAMSKADAIQVRCPGNLGLLGALLAPLFSPYRIAKYAGQWNGYEGEANSYRWQRDILQSKWWNAPVLVYGEWPNQPTHIKPFFTSIMNHEQIERAKGACVGKRKHIPLRILFVGRLSRSKNVHVLIESLGNLYRKEVPVHAHIIGIGPELIKLQERTAELSLPEDKIAFLGGMNFEDILPEYEWADVLVLVSETEGWPKVIAEAMAFGLICIGSNRGLVPQILADGRGLVIEPGDENALSCLLMDICLGKVDFSSISKKASQWAHGYSLDCLRRAIRDVLIHEWHLTDSDLEDSHEGKDRRPALGR